METLSGSYYQQAGSNLETGIKASVKGEEGPSLAIGAKYTVANGLAVRGKVDNKNQVGLGCEVKVMDGAALFLSTKIDMNNFEAGGHKVGLALEFA